MTPEQQIILQTIGDLWLCLSASVIIASFIQFYIDFKRSKQ